MGSKGSFPRIQQPELDPYIAATYDVGSCTSTLQYLFKVCCLICHGEYLSISLLGMSLAIFVLYGKFPLKELMS